MNSACYKRVARLTCVSGYICLSILLFSCKKNNNEPTASESTGPVVLNKNTHVVSAAAVTDLTDNTISISDSVARPAQGDVLISAPAAGRPYGLLRKVTGVTASGGKYVCTTEQASLNEAFEQLTIDTSYTEAFAASAAFKGADLDVTFNNEATIMNGIKLSGKIKINVSEVQFQYVKKTGSLKPEKMLLYANMNTEGSELSMINGTDNPVTIVEEKVLKVFDLPTLRIMIPVGPFVLPVPLMQKVTIKTMPVKVGGKLEWKIYPVITTTIGVKYENGAWQNLSSFSIKTSADSLYKKNFTVGASLKASVVVFNPVYEIAPYGSDLLKAYFEIPNTLTLDLQTESPNYHLKWQTAIKGGLKTKLWMGEDNEVNAGSTLIDYTIKKGDWIDSTVYDIDGNEYHIVEIGKQKWLKENLKVGRYNNGDPITTGLTGVAWINTSAGAYTIYMNDATNNTVYGKLYNWYAVADTRKVCPTGWHVATWSDWDTLTTYLGGMHVAGRKLKDVAYWAQPNLADNSSGFSGLPAGAYYGDQFDELTETGYWWTSTPVDGTTSYNFNIYNVTEHVDEDEDDKYMGYSIRCKKN